MGFRTALIVLATAVAAPAQAQVDPAGGYPSRPIHVIVGFAAGGGTDVIARLLGQKLTEGTGQSVVIENKLGASGIIATEFVAKAKPDGYTLLMSPSAPFTTNPIMYAKLPYAPVDDFTPISAVVTFPWFLVANASAPVQSMKDLVEYVKANPQKANYAGSASAFQLALELFKLRTGTKVEYIPFKGTNESINAVMAGEVLMSMGDAGPVTGPLKGGRVRGLAVTSAARSAAFPDIPTVAEAGFPDMEIQSWMGLFTPAGTPAGIVRKLQDEVNRIVRLPDVRERMNSLQLEPAGITSEQFARTIAADLERWRSVAKAGNIKPTD
jgi:tripartite-type tricarboxylate transporter receptor subunit TctC